MWRMRLPWLSSILFSQFQKGVLLDMANSILETISSEFASAAEKVGSSVVAVQARRWMPTSGIEWKKGVVVTVHTVYSATKKSTFCSVVVAQFPRNWPDGILAQT